MPVVLTPWETRSLSILGTGVSGKLPFFSDSEFWTVGATYGASPPGSAPWTVTGNRITTMDAAKNATPLHGGVPLGHDDADPATLDGAYYRMVAQYIQVGLETEAIADRTLFGTFYDDYGCEVRLGLSSYTVHPQWLGVLYEQPIPGTPVFDPAATALSVSEWDTLFGPLPGGPYTNRMFDLAGLSVTLRVEYTVTDATNLTGGSPAFSAGLAPPSLLTENYHPPSVIDPLPVAGPVDGTQRVVGVTSDNWVDGTSTPIGPPLWIDGMQASDTYADARPDGAAAAQWGIRQEWLSAPSIWPYGFDGGYDDHLHAGGSRYGGNGANWYATIRARLWADVTIRQRFYGFFTGTPPLWQRQRIGARDAPEGFASGLVTPQSSPWQGGTL